MKPARSHGQLTPLDEALAAVRALCLPLSPEEVSLRDAYGRILAEEVRAARDLPSADVSMMDGYALRAADASAPLQVVLEVKAGDGPSGVPLGHGEAARIFTGAPVPAGADCVVMQEHARRDGFLLEIAPEHAPRPGQHLRHRGEEVRQGASVLPVGLVLGGADLSLAAGSCGATVRVYARPRVAILPTGDELVPLGTVPPPGKLVESNTLSLGPLCREAGALPLLLGQVGDDVASIAAALNTAPADVLLTTGGASVGDHDHAQEAFERLGGRLVFHSVAIRPGKPVLFGTAAPLPGRDRPRLVFGLPGNPAAATLGFELFVRLALRLLQGEARPERTLARAVLKAPLSRVPGLTFFPRGHAFFEGSRLCFQPGGQQSSMQIASWSQVNAVAQVPPGVGRLEPGDEVDVRLLGPL